VAYSLRQSMQRLWSGCLVLSVALGLGLVAARAQGTPIPVDQYWADVEETLRTIENLKKPGVAASTIRASLDAQAGQWEAIRQVELEDGSVIPIDHSYLSSRLRADPPDLDGLETYLRAMLGLRDRWLETRPGISSTTWQTDQSKLSDILNREEFQWQTASPNPLQKAIDRLWQQVLNWLSSILPRQTFIGGRILQWIVIVAATLVLCLLLWLGIRSISGSLITEAGADEAQGLDEAITADGALRKAQETSRAGDYRSAVRWLYLSSLLILEEKGLLRYDRSRTNREYLLSVAQSPKLAGALRSVIDVFDRVWYGFQPIDPGDYDRYVEQVSELRRLR
jgi:hypothetical protein